MRLRVRHAQGIATLSDLREDQTISVLKDSIRIAVGLDVAQDLSISGGYPPKPFNDMDTTLANAGLRDGDTLNIKVLDNTPQQHQQSNTAAVSSTFSTLKEGSLQTANGALQLRVMDDDNSCLFRSIGIYVLQRDTTISQELRKVIVDGIKNDPDMYSDVTLGKSRDSYMEWIQKPNSWGGAIELAIFSAHFCVEIDSIDVQTGRIDKFGEGLYDECVLIVYSGIHYDALALAPSVDSPPDFDQTRFAVSERSILDAARQLVDELRKSHKYTDVANFTLKCEQCNAGLQGEKDAQDHATTTGHTRFTEYA